MPTDENHPGFPSGPALANEPARFADPWQTRMLGIGLIVLSLLLGYLFVLMWNSNLAGNASDTPPVCVFRSALCFYATLDSRLLIIVMLAGALGSFIHAATSFGDFVGNKRLTTNWLWWYILKPFIGTVLAVIFYLVVRGGFLAGDTQAENINLYGVTALACMVGMFSKQATDKLSEVFDTMFKTTPGGGDLKRREGLDNPVPVLSGCEPARVAAHSSELTITLSGKSFVSGSVVRINGSARTTAFKDSTHLTATLLDEDVTQEGQLSVTVLNPPPGGGTSEPLALTIGGVPGAPQALAPVDDSEAHIDGCDVDITAPTADEDLPAARGGVAT
jgi:hypothetical protein